MAPLLERLREIGLGDYEAKLYLALVKRHPATGYELARSSGVPSSKVYEVLGRLQEKDLVFVADGGARGKRYIPVDPEEFIERYRPASRALDGSTTARAVGATTGRLHLERPRPGAALLNHRPCGPCRAR
jgi:hypothetical protein